MPLIQTGASFPLDHYCAAVIDVPPISMASVAGFSTEMLDVTLCGLVGVSDQARRYIPGCVTVYGHDGAILLEGSPEVADAALRGGGQFMFVLPNPEYTVAKRRRMGRRRMGRRQRLGLGFRDDDWGY